MEPYSYGTKHISNRIAKIHFRFYTQKVRKLQVTIINVYAQRVNQKEEEATEFYDKLGETYNLYSAKSHYVIITGDLNAKLGTKVNDAEDFMGSHGKGIRNRNGHLLAIFLQNNQLYATNTTFDQPFRHRTTWSMRINGKMRYNQIDYKLIHQDRQRNGHQRQLVKSRSYNGIKFESDHRLVITWFNFRSIDHRVTNQNGTPPEILLKFDRTALSSKAETQENYQNLLNEALEQTTEEEKVTAQQYFEKVLKQLLLAAKTGIPEAPPSIRTTSSGKYLDDLLIIEWTKQRKNLRNKLNGHPNKKKAEKYRRWRSTLKR